MENDHHTTAPKPMAEITLSRFVLSADEAASLASREGVSLPDLLPSLVPEAMSLSRPPISRFCVGAVGLGSSGRIYFGVNLEFPGAPLHHSVHAEQFLVTNAAIHGEPSLSHIAVSSVPCGHCRQFLQELRSASGIQILVASPDTRSPDPPRFVPLADLLPHPFGPSDLLHHEAPLLLEPRAPDLVLAAGADDGGGSAICNGIGGLDEELRAAALEAARRSHAPYSGCPAGFAVGDEDGRVFAGAYAESAAYNPSLGPVQAALIAYVAGGGGAGEAGYGKIVAAALVERGDAPVRHGATARVLMAEVAPECRVAVYHCRRVSVGES